MRGLAPLGVVLLTLALINPAFAQPFADTPTNHWAYDAIAELPAKGLIEGYPDGTFKGDRAMTRYEMAMVVARLLARKRFEGKVSAMRQFTAVAVLGASLAFTAGAAFASDQVDYKPAFQPRQNVAIVNRTEPVQPVVSGFSGVATPVSVWSESRYENYGR